MCLHPPPLVVAELIETNLVQLEDSAVVTQAFNRLVDAKTSLCITFPLSTTSTRLEEEKNHGTNGYEHQDRIKGRWH